MLLSRCAWHPKFFGRRRSLGVVSWWAYGWRVVWSDGICGECREELRREIRAHRREVHAE